MCSFIYRPVNLILCITKSELGRQVGTVTYYQSRGPGSISGSAIKYRCICQPPGSLSLKKIYLRQHLGVIMGG